MTLRSLLGLSLTCLTASTLAAAGVAGVAFQSLADRVEVTLGGEPFTTYWFTNVAKPYCWPVLGPQGERLTRDWPMKETPGEEHDHPHHRGLWFTHGEVNGVDFWSETEKAGKTVHAGFLEISDERGVLVTSNRWVALDGRVICADTRKLRFFELAGGTRGIDFQITLHAGAEPLVFGDTKEGTLGLRLAETMRVKLPAKLTNAPGHIALSTGERDAATWGKRAPWCDYTGLVGGKLVGAAIFDHPTNPRHPTWWHVRDYGLFAANPFGRHDFEKLSDKQAGNLTVPAGGSVTFNYRVLFHAGDTGQAQISERFAEYAATPVAR